MLTDQDIHRLREETLGCGVTTHFNHSGASLPPAAMTAAITEHLQREARYGPHEAAAKVQDRLVQMRSDAADLLGAGADEIAITSSGSAGWGLTFAALPPFQPGDRILVGRQEWGGNLATLSAACRRSGARVEVIPCREDGAVDPIAFAAMIDERVRLIALTWLPANGGLINDAAAIGKIARAHCIPYFVDAGQALGQLPVDVVEIGCDMLKGAGRKFLRGPRGTALLYVRRDFLPRLTPVFLDVQSAPWSVDSGAMREDARRFETSETPVALWLGLGAALALAQDLRIARVRNRIAPLADYLRAELSRVPGVSLQDLGGPERSGLVSFTVERITAQKVREWLAAEHRISVAANGVRYTPLDMQVRGLTEIVRASVSYLNTAAEVDRLVSAVAGIAGAENSGQRRHPNVA